MPVGGFLFESGVVGGQYRWVKTKPAWQCWTASSDPEYIKMIFYFYRMVQSLDIVDQETRSRMMAAVKGRDTRYEIAIRKRLFAKGFRYRIDNRKLPGRPDIVFPKHKVIIFVNGCFWHYHGCHLSRIPKSRTEWWREKLEGNRQRDARNLEALTTSGWRVLVIWECSFRRPGVRKETAFDHISEIASKFILSDSKFLEIVHAEPDCSLRPEFQR